MSYTVNSLESIAPILLREGLLALRENSIAVRLCQFDVSQEAAKKGATIDVEIPPAVPAQEVNLAAGKNTATPLVPDVVPVKLTNWFEAVFSMSDKDMTEVESGILPAAASEAIKSLANLVDVSCINLYKELYGFHGVAGTTPSAITDITGPRKVLNKQLAPITDRAMLFDVEAEAKMLELDLFISSEKVGDTMALREGSLGRKLGFDIHMDQNMVYHVAGDLAASVSIAVTGATAAGATTLILGDSSGTPSLTGGVVQGDLITIAGSTQSHVITEPSTAAGNAISIKISPPLPAEVADGTVVTLIGSHQVNLAFNKQCFCFVSRPLQALEGLGSIVQSIVDPISGLTLRLEITRENKQIRWSYDILWGTKVIRPQYGCRLLG